MIILGIDPGSVITGYAVLKKERDDKRNLTVIDFGCLITEKNLTGAERLIYIHQSVASLIKKHQPEVMSIENVFFFKNVKTIMPVSQTKGVILLAAALKKIPVLEFTPLQIKMAITGYGRAEKKQVQKMIEEMLDLQSFDIKQKFRKKDDAYDALGVAICAAIKSY